MIGARFDFLDSWLKIIICFSERSVLLILLCALYSALNLASGDSPSPELNEYGITWEDGERYDAYRGTMNYFSTDLSLPGHGKLPIEIHRSYSQFGRWALTLAQHDARSNLAFGKMDLSIPKVTMARARNSSHRYKGCKDLRATVRSVKFTYGEQVVKFYPVNIENRHLAKQNFETIASMEYISIDNWAISCHDLAGDTISADDESVLTVHSPDGIRYQLKRDRRENVYKADRTFDTYGNWVAYKYEPFKQYTPCCIVNVDKLTSITANDGRSVKLTYKENKIRNVTGPNSEYAMYTYWRIDSISSNGHPQPRKLTYDYEKGLTVSENNLVIKHYSFNHPPVKGAGFNGRVLRSITDDVGDTITYEYRGVSTDDHEDLDKWSEVQVRKGTVEGKMYDQLISRKVERTGKKFKFEYHLHNWKGKRTLSRLVRTEVGATEYRFRVRTIPDDYTVGVGSNLAGVGYTLPDAHYTIEDAKIIQQKVFEDPEVIWQPAQVSTLLLDKTYSYKSLYKISKLLRQDTHKIVLNRTLTRLYPDERSSSSNIAEFVTGYDEYDFRGYPTVIREGSSSTWQGTRTKTISYEHDDFLFWIIGKPVTQDVDGIDIVSIDYTQKGDVKRVTNNHLSVLENDWYSGGPNNGELRATVDNKVGKTEFADYFRGQARTITDAVGRVKTVSINSDATIKSETRFGDYRETKYIYDGLRRLVRTEPAREASNPRIYQWSSNNRQRLEKSTELLEFDRSGRILAKGRYGGGSPEFWSSEVYQYDMEGRLVFETRPQQLHPGQLKDNAGLGRHYTYDGLGRISTIRDKTYGQQILTQFAYGVASNGNLTVTETDGRGMKTVVEFTSFGEPDYQWPVGVTEADGTRTTINRDSVGKVLSHTRSNVTTYYRYNANNLVDQIERPEDSITNFSYNEYGKLTRRTNNGRSANYTYYPDFKIKQVEYSDNSGASLIRKFSYNQYGELERMSVESSDGKQNNAVIYHYDEEGNLLREELHIDDQLFSMQYEYDGWSNRKTIQYPNGNRYALTPNRLGDPKSIKQIGGSTEEKVIYDLIQYNADRSARLLRRSSHQIIHYVDVANRPFRSRLEQYGGLNALLASKEYFYDGANNVSRINDSANQRYNTFEYDSRNRLISESGGAHKWTFSYLASDDISSISHGENFTQFNYDAHSKRLSKVIQNGVHRHFEYDAHGNMTHHESVSISGSKKGLGFHINAANQIESMSDGTQFQYDAIGLRVKQDRGGPIYSFYDKDKRLIYRADIAAGVTSEYFYVNKRLVARRDGDLSDPGSSAAESPLASVTLSPSGGGTSQDPTYKWTAVPDALNYYVDVRRADGDEVLVYKKYSPSAAGCSSGTGWCAIKKSDSPMSGSNRWRVRSENREGHSEWSKWESFHVGN